MKPVLLLPLLALIACASHDAPACRGEVFQLNPSRMGTLAMLAAAPVIAPAGSVAR